jgi:hypothetical protein
VEEAEALFSIMDEEGKGSLDSERIQMFLMALLLNEIKE